jgi:hypothetical protein
MYGLELLLSLGDKLKLGEWGHTEMGLMARIKISGFAVTDLSFSFCVIKFSYSQIFS